MRSRIAAVGAAVALALSVIPVLSAPAQAITAPVISAVDTSTPGHAKFRVTTDAAYVHLIGTDVEKVVPTSGGVASFDLPVWGFKTLDLKAFACGPTPNICSPTTAMTSVSIPAQDVASVTWDSDRFLGANETFSVTYHDTFGGFLGVRDSLTGNWSFPSNDAVNELSFWQDGARDLTFVRCSTSWNFCRPASGTVNVYSNAEIPLTITGTLPKYVRPDTTTAPDVEIDFRDSEPDADQVTSLTISWALSGAQASRNGTKTVPITNHTAPLPLDLTGLPDGDYALSVQVSATSTLTDSLSWSANYSYGVVVDTRSPEVGIVEAPTAGAWFPYVDQFRDARWVVQGDESFTVRLEARDDQGQLVATAHGGLIYEFDAAEFRWNGRGNQGRWITGPHTISLIAVDRAGNESLIDERTAMIYPHRLSSRETTIHATAKKTAWRWHGKCSSFKSPSSHHWAGSLALNSLTKCKKKTWKKSGLIAVYEKAIPPALEYQKFRVMIRGASGKAKPGSLAFAQTWNARAGEFRRGAAKLETHQLKNWVPFPNDPEAAIYNGRYVAWRVFTGAPARYDVGKSDLIVNYVVLAHPVTGALFTEPYVFKPITGQRAPTRALATAKPIGFGWR